MAKKTKKKPQQRVMSFGRGGWRPGAGRPRSNRRNKRVLHRRRPRVTRHTPAHITLRVVPEVTSLRTKKRAQVLRRAFVASCARDGFRIIDWSVQGNHLHLIVEADGNAQLSRGMQAFTIRAARGLNRLAGRKGAVFTERYHIHVLTTPAEVRNARAYVLNNFRRHAAQRGHRVSAGWVDPCSSWAWCDGWRNLPQAFERSALKERTGPPVVGQPESWLLRVGWRRRGLIDVNETPSACVRPT
jgi:REP element-mobilizing transposase RayT